MIECRRVIDVDTRISDDIELTNGFDRGFEVSQLIVWHRRRRSDQTCAMSEEMDYIDFLLLALSESVALGKFGNNIDNTGGEIQFPPFEAFQDKDIGECLSH